MCLTEVVSGHLSRRVTLVDSVPKSGRSLTRVRGTCKQHHVIWESRATSIATRMADKAGAIGTVSGNFSCKAVRMEDAARSRHGAALK